MINDVPMPAQPYSLFGVNEERVSCVLRVIEFLDCFALGCIVLYCITGCNWLAFLEITVIERGWKCNRL